MNVEEVPLLQNINYYPQLNAKEFLKLKEKEYEARKAEADSKKAVAEADSKKAVAEAEADAKKAVVEAELVRFKIEKMTENEREEYFKAERLNKSKNIYILYFLFL